MANTGDPYREALSLVGSKHSGSPLAPLVIEGNGAVLDGLADIPSTAWIHVDGDLFYFHPARLNYQQLFLNGRPTARQPTSLPARTLPNLKPLQWCLFQGKMYLRVEPGKMPDAYRPACCRLQTGITLYYVHNVVIRNLVVQGFQIDGISIHDVVDSALIEGVTCRGNGRSGIFARGASRVTIFDCVIGNNGESQFTSEDFAKVNIEHSDLIGTTAPALLLRGGLVTIDGKPAADKQR